MTETLSEFKNSFYYGSRTDLSFKFLAIFSDEETAVFIQDLFLKTVDAMDDGDWTRVSEHIMAGQTAAYNKIGNYVYDEGPFVPLAKPLSELKLGLLTSSGHFIAGDDPQPFGLENMSQEEAMARITQFLREAPHLSAIPMDTPAEKLRVRHGGYDIRGAQVDNEVVLPLKMLQGVAAGGKIGELHHEAYSFVGACAQTPLIKKTAPQWAAQLQAQKIDALLLVPA